MADKKPKRRGLGRGLSALMSDVVLSEQSGAPNQASAADHFIPVENIQPNPNQPRRSFTPDQLEDLTNSIREKGIIQPLILRKNKEEPGTYQIVAGERRWRAAQAAQLHQVPALVRDYDDTEVLEVAIIENIQRADLNPIEEAAGYRQLMDRFGHTQERLGEALGKSRSHIANLLRLLTLPDDVQRMLSDGKLSAGHARALVTMPNAAWLARQVVSKGLSVRETENLVKNASVPPRPRTGKAPRTKDADTRALEQDLSAALGMTTGIEHKSDGQSGQISIQYSSLDELDELCRILSNVRL